MPTSDEREQVVDHIESLVEQIGDSVLGRTNDDTENTLIGAVHGTYRYIIEIPSDSSFVTVRYVFDLVPALTLQKMIQGVYLHRIFDTPIDIGIPLEQYDVDQEKIPAAVREDNEPIFEHWEAIPDELRDQLPFVSTDDGPELDTARGMTRLRAISPDRASKIRAGLIERVSHPAVAYQLQSDDEGYLRGVVISKKLFPYEDELDPERFNDAVQAVISVGVLGTEFLRRVYDIGSAEEPIQADESEPFDPDYIT